MKALFGIFFVLLCVASLHGQSPTSSPSSPPIVRSELPAEKVFVQICETGLSDKNEWPSSSPAPSESYPEDVFGFFEVPHKYVDTGVTPIVGIRF